MPFPFSLPTTSHVSIPAYVSSITHAALPSSASSQRSVLRSALKAHKRLAPTEQSAHLSSVLSALESYIPLLFALENGLSDRPVANEEVQIDLNSEIEVEWRPTLSSANIPGRDASRVKGHGLEYELCSVLQTLATLHNLLARQQLLTLYSPTIASTAARLTAIQTATKNLLTASSIHNYLLQRSQSSPTSFPPSAVDITSTTQSALSALSLAEATLLFVLKDDPYPQLVQQSLSKTDKDWMITAPTIPKVRTHLFARLCVSASDHAVHASASLLASSSSSSTDANKKVSSDLKAYCSSLSKTAKAKAYRFLGIDADASGKTGEGIAWLRAARHTLDSSTTKLSRGSSLKSSWSSSKEDKRLAKGASDWGLDAGRHEELRILEWLEKKWIKMNDTVNVQVVPEWRDLIKETPSGRDVHEKTVWRPPMLDAEDLAVMRLGPMRGRGGDGAEGFGDSSGEEGLDEEGADLGGVVGAFPGTREDYVRSQSSTSQTYF